MSARACPPAASPLRKSADLPSQTLANARELGIETGVDLDRLIEAALLAEQTIGRALPGKVMHGGGLDRLRARARERSAAA